MQLSFGALEDHGLQVLWEDGDRVFCRGWRLTADGRRGSVLVVRHAAEHPSPSSLERFTHEYGLKDELDAAWAARPLELGRTTLVLEDPGGEPLDRYVSQPMEMGQWLRLAIGLATLSAPFISAASSIRMSSRAMCL